MVPTGFQASPSEFDLALYFDMNCSQPKLTFERS